MTFVLGYGLSFFDKQRELNRKKRNIKAMIFKEMKENFRYLNGVMKKGENDIGHPDFVADFCLKISCEVYDNYLDRMNELNKQEIESIYDTYVALKEAKSSSEIYIQEKSELNELSNIERIALLNLNISSSAMNAYAKLESTISLFNGGHEFLNEMNNDRGKALELLKEAEQYFGKDDQD